MDYVVESIPNASHSAKPRAAQNPWFAPIVPFMLSIAIGILCYRAAGISLGLFLGGLLLIALITGPMVAAEATWIGRGLAILGIIHGIAAVWLYAVVHADLEMKIWAASYLTLACMREKSAIAGQVTEAFSKIALWLVPGILGAGVVLGLLLVRHVAEFRSGYGLSLIAKSTGFMLLLGLAALNKWRLGPAIATGDQRAIRWFRRSLRLEYVLIAAVLSITAMMTTFYSPEP